MHSEDYQERVKEKFVRAQEDAKRVIQEAFDACWPDHEGGDYHKDELLTRYSKYHHEQEAAGLMKGKGIRVVFTISQLDNALQLKAAANHFVDMFEKNNNPIDPWEAIYAAMHVAHAHSQIVSRDLEKMPLFMDAVHATKCSEAVNKRYQSTQELVEEALIVADEKWKGGDDAYHNEMRDYLLGMERFKDIPRKTMLRACKELALRKYPNRVRGLAQAKP